MASRVARRRNYDVGLYLTKKQTIALPLRHRTWKSTDFFSKANPSKHVPIRAQMEDEQLLHKLVNMC